MHDAQKVARGSLSCEFRASCESLHHVDCEAVLTISWRGGWRATFGGLKTALLMPWDSAILKLPRGANHHLEATISRVPRRCEDTGMNANSTGKFEPRGPRFFLSALFRKIGRRGKIAARMPRKGRPFRVLGLGGFEGPSRYHGVNVNVARR